MKFKFNNTFVRKTVIVKSDYGVEYRHKVHNGNEIWLYWFGAPFRLKMEDDGSFTIAQEGLRGPDRNTMVGVSDPTTIRQNVRTPIIER